MLEMAERKTTIDLENEGHKFTSSVVDVARVKSEQAVSHLYDMFRLPYDLFFLSNLNFVNSRVSHRPFLKMK